MLPVGSDRFGQYAKNYGGQGAHHKSTFTALPESDLQGNTYWNGTEFVKGGYTGGIANNGSYALGTGGGDRISTVPTSGRGDLVANATQASSTPSFNDHVNFNSDNDFVEYNASMLNIFA